MITLAGIIIGAIVASFVLAYVTSKQLEHMRRTTTTLHNPPEETLEQGRNA